MRRLPTLLLLALLSASAPAQSASERIAEGRDLLRSNRVSDALLQFAVARRLEPENLEAQLGYQDCKLTWGRYEELVAIFDAHLEADPQDPVRRYLSARVRERPENRVRDLQELAREPLAPDLRLRILRDLGNAQIRARDFRGAESTFRQALTQSPGNVDARLGVALAMHARGELKGAENELLAIVVEHPKEARAFYGIANLHLDTRGLLDTRAGRRRVGSAYQPHAERYLLKAVTVDEDYFEPRSDLARLYYDQRRSKEARRLLTDYMEAHPLDPRPYVLLAEYDLAEGLDEIAEKHLRRYLRRAQPDPDVLVNLAVACMQAQMAPEGDGTRSREGFTRIEKRMGEAEELLRQALELHPRHASAWVNLGHLLYRTGRPAEAAEAFRRAESSGARPEECSLNLGRSLAAFGRILRDQAAELTGSGRARDAEALQEQAREQLAAASAEYERALELQPGHGKLRVELARVYLNLSRGGDAVRHLKLALHAPAERPTALEVDYLLACAYLLQGQLDQARAHVERILQVQPRHTGALELRRQIERAWRDRRR